MTFDPTNVQPSDKPESWGLADAISDGSAEAPAWISRKIPELDLEVLALRRPLRRPLNGRMLVVSSNYEEQLSICHELKAISSTHAVFQALWRLSTVKLTPKPEVFTAADSLQMGTLTWLLKANDAYEAELADPKVAAALGATDDSDARGYWKAWLIGALMTEQGATTGAENEGFIYPDGHELQHEGGMHNWLHLDYSQAVADLVLRVARRISTGALVDLREVFAGLFPQLAGLIRNEYPDDVDLVWPDAA